MSAAGHDHPVYLVDGTAQLFRAYFAIRDLTNADGLPTNAVYGFTTMLRKLVAEEQPQHLAIAFDRPGPVFRHERYPDYKANRPPAPEDLNQQQPWAREVCRSLGMAVVELDGYEADDLIATYTRLAREQGRPVVVVASDKDLFQLVADGVTLLNPVKGDRLDAQGVRDQFGVLPDQVRDVLGLMGDSVDNIPGVPGVGEKTALAIVSRYGDVEAVLARARRFTSLFRARDRALDAIVLFERGTEQEPSPGSPLAEALDQLRGPLDAYLDGEPPGDTPTPGELRTQLAGLDLAPLRRAEQGGRAEARPLRELKRSLRSLEKGSSRKVWFSIDEHADSARLSRELATLDREVPPPLPLAELRIGQGDPDRARELFATLGFRSLLDEFATDAPDLATEDDAPETTWRRVASTADLAELARRLTRTDRISLQLFADGPDPLRAGLRGLGLASAGEEACFVPVGDTPGAADPGAIREHLGPLLATGRPVVVGHDLKSAAHLLRRHDLRLGRWGLDTMVAAFLLDPGRTGYAFGRLCEEFLGRGPQRAAPEQPARGDLLEPEMPEEAMAAVAELAELALELAGHLENRLSDEGLDRLYATLDGPLLPVLERMEAWGIRVDVARLEGMSGEMEHSLDRHRTRIHELAGMTFNVDSPKQLREILFDRLGLKARRKTAKSRVASTDAQTLEELAAEHEIAREMLAYRELAKLKGTYVDSLPRLVHPDTGRVHTSYHPTGAATGRLSSSDPNMQNIPARTEAGRRIRSAFVPDGGYRFLAADYSQIELRILAHLTGDRELIAAFNADEDIHRYTASRVFGVLPELVTGEMRQRAKAVNFGILYGMSETRLAREQGMSRRDARRFIDAYFDRFASVREYIETVRQQALEQAMVHTLFGRVRRFPQLHRRIHRGMQEQALRAAVNTTIQGTAADLMKMAMLRVAAELEQADLGARMLLQVHDELLLEVPVAQVDRTVELVCAAMEGVHPLEVPLAVDHKVGRSWEEVT